MRWPRGKLEVSREGFQPAEQEISVRLTAIHVLLPLRELRDAKRALELGETVAIADGDERKTPADHLGKRLSPFPLVVIHRVVDRIAPVVHQTPELHRDHGVVRAGKPADAGRRDMRLVGREARDLALGPHGLAVMVYEHRLAR